MNRYYKKKEEIEMPEKITFLHCKIIKMVNFLPKISVSMKAKGKLKAR